MKHKPVTSRNIKDLSPSMQQSATDIQEILGDKILIYCTSRSFEDQARAYRNGRNITEITSMANRLTHRHGREDLADILIGVGPQWGREITKAAPGQSAHNYGMAFDAAPIRNGKILWSVGQYRMEWEEYVQAVRFVGLESLFRMNDWPHAQQPGFDWKEMISA